MEGTIVAKQYHVMLEPGDIGRYVLLPGDPGRCVSIAEHFDDAEFVTQNREYTTYRGTLLGVPVAVTSTGIGGPSTAIAVEELARVGADTFIRVGTAGGVHPSVQTGDMVIATGAIRDEGTSHQYVSSAFPAVAHTDVVAALRFAAEESGRPFRLGVSHSKDSFFGEVEMGRMPSAARLQEHWAEWVGMGTLCSEMEASTIFIVSSYLGCRAGAIMQVISPAPSSSPDTLEGANHAEWLENGHVSTQPVVATAVAALKRLIEMDSGLTP
jgi:uridine phosphorylase